MTSREFIALTSAFIQSSSSFDYLFSALTSMREANVALRDTTAVFAKTDINHVASVLNSFDATLGKAADSIKHNFESRKMWAGVEILGERLSNLRTSKFAEEIVSVMADQLADFSNAYEDFIRTYSRDATLNLLRRANDLYLALDSVRTMAVLAEKELGPTLSPVEGEETIEIIIGASATASELAKKVETLVQLYEKLCELLSVSTASNPLRIAKVESGSLWFSLIGNSGAIRMMTDILMATARYMYRNFTTEGKIRELPRRAEALEAIIGLREKLEEQELNVEGMKENIEKAAIALSQQAQVLLAGQSKIIINATEIGIGGEQTQPQLFDRERPLLSDSSNPEATA